MSAEPNGNAGSSWQLRLLLGEGLGHHPPGRSMNAHVGHGSEPVGELGVQVVEIAKRPAEEEVLADVAERPFHLAFGLRPVGSAGFRVKVVMASGRRASGGVDALRRFMAGEMPDSGRALAGVCGLIIEGSLAFGGVSGELARVLDRLAPV